MIASVAWVFVGEEVLRLQAQYITQICQTKDYLYFLRSVLRKTNINIVGNPKKDIKPFL